MKACQVRFKVRFRLCSKGRLTNWFRKYEQTDEPERCSEHDLGQNEDQGK